MDYLAGSVEDTGGVYFVTAFSGLLAPYWDRDATGTIIGLTSYTTSAHIARATLEAVCFQTRAVLDVIESESGVKLETLKVDGGVTNSDLAMQLQANVSGASAKSTTLRTTLFRCVITNLSRSAGSTSLVRPCANPPPSGALCSRATRSSSSDGTSQNPTHSIKSTPPTSTPLSRNCRRRTGSRRSKGGSALSAGRGSGIPPRRRMRRRTSLSKRAASTRCTRSIRRGWDSTFMHFGLERCGGRTSPASDGTMFGRRKTGLRTVVSARRRRFEGNMPSPDFEYGFGQSIDFNLELTESGDERGDERGVGAGIGRRRRRGLASYGGTVGGVGSWVRKVSDCLPTPSSYLQCHEI